MAQSVATFSTRTSTTADDRSHASSSQHPSSSVSPSTIAPLRNDKHSSLSVAKKRSVDDPVKRFDAAVASRNDSSFFGRAQELHDLKAMYHRIMMGKTTNGHGRNVAADHDQDRSPCHFPAAFIWGLSGTGKSRLVEQFCDEVREKEDSAAAATAIQQQAKHEKDGDAASNPKPKPYIIQGKHDEHTGIADPFGAIIQAFTSFANQVVANEPPEEVACIRSLIKAALTDDGKSIIKIVPAFQKLLGADSTRNAEDASAVSNSSSTQSSLQYEQMVHGYDTLATDMAQNRLRYIFLSLIKAIATKERPLVLFLDDLQWSSNATMDLIQMVLMDKNLHGFFLVGTIRQDPNPHTNEVMEMDSNLPLSVMLRSLQEAALAAESATSTRRKGTPCWLDVHLSNMSLDDTRGFLASVLQQPAGEVAQLASDIHKNTSGNVYFILQLVQHIQANIMANDGDIGTGDTDAMMLASAKVRQGSSNDIVDLIASRIDRLSPKLRTALIVASHIQFEFDIGTLCIALHSLSVHIFDSVASFAQEERSPPSHQDKPITESEVEQLLEEAVLSGLLLHTIGTTIYKFSHDRIQQAAKTLVLGEDRGKLRYRLGLCLLGIYHSAQDSKEGDGNDPSRYEYCKQFDGSKNRSSSKFAPSQVVSTAQGSSLLFIAADHLNSIPSKHHLFNASLNTEVAQEATDLGALTSALKYCEVAFAELGKIRTPWKDHYDLTLRLHRVRADVELALGNFDVGCELVNEVCQNSRSVTDSIPTIISKSEALGRQSRGIDSIAVTLQPLQSTRMVPKRGVIWTIMKDLMWIKMYFRNHTDKEVLSLPLLTEPKYYVSMDLMNQVMAQAVQNGSVVTDWLICTMKSIRMTLKHGICKHSALAFTFLSILSLAQNDQQGAKRFADLAIAILRQTNSEGSGGFVYCVCAVTIYRWSEPFTKCLSLFRTAYYASMERGDLQNGFITMFTSIMYSYFDGYPVDKINRAMKMLIDEKELYKEKSNMCAIKHCGSGPSMLLGETPIDWEEFASFGDTVESIMAVDTSGNAEPITDEKEKLYPLIHGYCVRLWMCILFSNFAVGEILVNKLHKLNFQDDPSYELQTIVPMYTGLVAAGRYRETKQRTHLSMLRRMCKSTQKLWKTKGQSCMGRALIIRAEWKSLKTPAKDWRRVKLAYDMAIAVSTEGGEPFKSCGHAHEAALACELAGNYFVTVQQHGLAKQYFTSALHYYQKWGATVKIDHFKKQHRNNINWNRLRQLTVASMQSGVGSGGSVPVVRFIGRSNDAASDHDDDLAYSLLYEDSLQSSKPPHQVGGGGTSIDHGPGNKSVDGGGSSLDHDHADDDDDDVSVLSDMS
eukprot:CAMPEP_0119546566 /NCGR_PEP_ID=MMETSP1352-20130426/933_1 /TAXON_ID=265584 /ORGANISM="Stauroneis constricta, Strain CCMP1120" /LENGTH=1343 /DNA_ID=CAMNT_0007591285 /DNA_START=65 /DNA_END=4096 /DNA_ORIENTATION=+